MKSYFLFIVVITLFYINPVVANSNNIILKTLTQLNIVVNCKLGIDDPCLVVDDNIKEVLNSLWIVMKEWNGFWLSKSKKIWALAWVTLIYQVSKDILLSTQRFFQIEKDNLYIKLSQQFKIKGTNWKNLLTKPWLGTVTGWWNLNLESNATFPLWICMVSIVNWFDLIWWRDWNLNPWKTNTWNWIIVQASVYDSWKVNKDYIEWKTTSAETNSLIIMPQTITYLAGEPKEVHIADFYWEISNENKKIARFVAIDSAKPDVALKSPNKSGWTITTWIKAIDRKAKTLDVNFIACVWY